jgi:hypothetical protein
MVGACLGLVFCGLAVSAAEADRRMGLQ